ncbi:hypothetical protein HK105_207988 [Polyrhizophydium stewartii]|uniref:PLOD1-3-like GT domain-containing protein n=1 Tax=Polyrhizophydium stewartii TaxID=2732419 RepID=A0ABR4MZ29_9FUNG
MLRVRYFLKRHRRALALLTAVLGLAALLLSQHMRAQAVAKAERERVVRNFGARAEDKVDPATGYLVPVNSDCNKDWNSNQLFSECSRSLLRSAVISQHPSSSHATSSKLRKPDTVANQVPEDGDRSQLVGSLPAPPAALAPAADILPAHAPSLAPADEPIDLSAFKHMQPHRDQVQKSPPKSSLRRALRSGGETSAKIIPGTSYNNACRAGDPACPVLWVSFTTLCRVGSNRFADSVTKAGIPLAVLGLGTVWKSRWGYRMRILHDFLVSQPDDRLIVWTDADDVVPVPGISVDRIIEGYQALIDMYQGPRIFFPAETACYPDGSLWSNYTDPNIQWYARGETPFRYLNAGLMVGPAGLIRRMIEVVYQDDCFDDQLAYTLAILDPLKWWRTAVGGTYRVSSSRNAHRIPPESAKPLIGLDYWNGLLLAMYGMPNKDYVVDPATRELSFIPTRSRPLILHQNGEKKDNRILEILSKEFGYDYDADVLESLKEKGLPYELESRRPRPTQLRSNEGAHH